MIGTRESGMNGRSRCIVRRVLSHTTARHRHPAAERDSPGDIISRCAAMPRIFTSNLLPRSIVRSETRARARACFIASYAVVTQRSNFREFVGHEIISLSRNRRDTPSGDSPSITLILPRPIPSSSFADNGCKVYAPRYTPASIGAAERDGRTIAIAIAEQRRSSRITARRNGEVDPLTEQAAAIPPLAWLLRTTPNVGKHDFNCDRALINAHT